MTLINSERYEIDPIPIGQGGFGEVYAALDLLHDKKVVVKTIIASQIYGMNEPEIRRKFFREAVVSARLGRQSKHIVEVFDYGYDRDSDIPFFVMEFIDGDDLSSQIGTMPPLTALLVFEQMLYALEVAHNAGVIHSDISPDNIMFDSTANLYKLNDFGLARILNSQLLSRGRTVTLGGGKLGFLPANDWQTGERTVHSDLYGLAVTIVYLMTGAIPTWSVDGKIYHPPYVNTDLMEDSVMDPTCGLEDLSPYSSFAADIEGRQIVCLTVHEFLALLQTMLTDSEFSIEMCRQNLKTASLVNLS